MFREESAASSRREYSGPPVPFHFGKVRSPAKINWAITPFTKTLSLLLPVRCSAMISTTGVGNERTAGMERLFPCQMAWDYFVCPLTRTDRFVWADQHSV